MVNTDNGSLTLRGKNDLAKVDLGSFNPKMSPAMDTRMVEGSNTVDVVSVLEVAVACPPRASQH
jgi:hypothetical protein